MWYIKVLLAISCVLVARATCPCKDPKWCEPVTQKYEHELYTFSVSNDNWRLYDWDKITTVAHFGARNDDMMCYAHSKGVRVVSAGAPSMANLTDPNLRSKWVKDVVQDIADRHLDGYNLDFERPILINKTKRDDLTSLVRELRQALSQILAHPQLTFDGSWGYDSDIRKYDYKSMAPFLDYVFIMAYDMRGIILRPIAWANCPLNYTHLGIEEYIARDIPADKLVLGLPWYGYVYKCITLSPDNVCRIVQVPFRGVNYSDAGSQLDYKIIVENLLNQSTSGLLWDAASASPYFNYKGSDGHMYQVWFDDVRSLKIKYELAMTMGLRGVGMFQADCLDYTNTTVGQQQRQEMWGALPDYKKEHHGIYDGSFGGKRLNVQH